MATTHSAAAAASTSAQPNVMADALKEAFYAGLIALGMFVLIVGLKTDQNIRNELIIVERWTLLFVVVAIVMIGRFAFSAFVWPEVERRRAIGKKAAIATEPGFLRRNINWIGVIALFLFPVPCSPFPL